MSVSEGENLMLRGFGWCSVVSTADPSLVTVKLPSGACVRMGYKAVLDLSERTHMEGATDGE